MKIAVFGTGSVGQALAGKLSQTGHTVLVGTRDVASTMARKENDAFGNPPFSAWIENHPEVTLVTNREAASATELLVNCTLGNASIETLRSAGVENLNGKILLDIANPLDFSQGFPPSLSVCNHTSLAEQIQQEFPQLKVVKSLNTMSAMIMVNPSLIGGDHSVFVSGNDADAKTAVRNILKEFGWDDRNILDLGDITTARGTEMLLPVWVRLFGALQTPFFNFHINKAGSR